MTARGDYPHGAGRCEFGRVSYHDHRKALDEINRLRLEVLRLQESPDGRFATAPAGFLQEIERLRAWKAEASAVLNEWEAVWGRRWPSWPARFIEGEGRRRNASFRRNASLMMTVTESAEWMVQVALDSTFRGVRQTIHGSPTNMADLTPSAVGNCYSACIASLLGVGVDDVPHIQHLRNIAEYHAAMELPWDDRRIAREWLRDHCRLDLCPIERATLDGMGVHYILTVKSHKGDWNHAVIARQGEVVWDPSGRDDYTIADVDPADTTGEALVLPYLPEPAEMVRRWRAEQVTS